jgi:hypothetical protein
MIAKRETEKRPRPETGIVWSVFVLFPYFYPNRLSMCPSHEGHKVSQRLAVFQGANVAELLSAFSADPSMRAFAEHFCAAPPSDPEGRDFSTFCSTILHECVASEKPAIVRTYLELYTSVHRVAEAVANGGGVSGLDCLTVANLKV